MQGVRVSKKPDLSRFVGKIRFFDLHQAALWATLLCLNVLKKEVQHDASGNKTID
jgi:hypothetical protein